MSEAAGDMEKGGACVRHILWTQARTSEKVGTVLTCQAARVVPEGRAGGGLEMSLGAIGPALAQGGPDHGRGGQHRHLAAVLTSENRQTRN